MKDLELLGNFVPMSALHHNARAVLSDLQEKKRMLVMKHHETLAVLLSPDEYLRLREKAGEGRSESGNTEPPAVEE